MKTLFVVVLVGVLGLPALGQTTGAARGQTPAVKTEGCAKCAATSTSVPQTPDAASSKLIPGTNETMLVGRVENLIPIGVLTVLGCEKCSAEAVGWALQQGSSFDDIERALRTVAAMQKLDCFKQQFGPEVNSRMEKPLAAAREALEQARTRAAK
jgi:alkylhydroperoxidase/carboxymuconolactone decarboxylase family protein YurZ